MIDLDELILKTQDICNQLYILKNQSQKESNVNSDDIKSIQLISRKYPIQNHILRFENEYIRKLYITALCSVVNIEDDLNNHKNQMIFVGRILFSFDSKVDLISYVNNSLKIDSKFVSEFSENITKEVAISFAVDALIICFVNGEINEKMLELAIEFISVLILSEKTLSNISILAKGIIKQDTDIILKLRNVNLNNFIGYMKNKPNGFIVEDLEKSKEIQENLFIPNVEFISIENVIDLDEYKAQTITFYKCHFSTIKGIKSNTKKVNFIKCYFDNIKVPASEKRSIWNQLKNSEKDFSILDLANCDITESKFEQCSISKNLIKFKTGNIQNCCFTNCTGIDVPASFLIDIERGNIENSVFENCSIDTDKADRGSTTGGIIVLHNGKIRKSKFLNCKAYGNTGYGSYATFCMNIVKLVNAHIADSEFSKCCCSSTDVSNKTVTSYILGLSNSTDKNTTFNECSSYHYNYSDMGSSYNKGEI